MNAKQLDIFSALTTPATPVAAVATVQNTARMRHLAYPKLGVHNGARRLWLEGRRLADVGFAHGVRYTASMVDGALVLRITPMGDHKVSGSGSRPVVDLVASALGDVDRCEVRFYQGEVRVTLHPTDKAATARLERLVARMAAAEPVRVGSLCHGGGVTADALTRGLDKAGLASVLTFGVELEPVYLEQAMAHNALWTAGALSVEGNLDEVDTRLLPQIDILDAGLPCTAASRAGRAKRGSAFAEDESKIAHLVYGFLRVIEATQPAVVVLENVVEYASTATAAIIRGQLGAWGYDVQERRVEGAEYALEARSRLVLVATTRGLAFDLGTLHAVEPRPAVVGDILDDVPITDPAWRTYSGIADKQVRDAAAGKSFKPQVVTVESATVPTIRRGYQKAGSTDPRLLHESGLSRLLTPAEHARCKGVPVRLIEGLSPLRAHQILGQSVVAPTFVALGTLLGETLYSGAVNPLGDNSPTV